jgi:CHAT domain-containing protein
MNRELASLQEIEPGIVVRTGAAVTKQAFLRAVGENFLLYYAGHSAFDVTDPLRSSILLDGDKPGPNSVSALDIIQQRMAKNGIVILASCDTSLGNFTDGPGIRGLTSAFLVSGAGSVIGSLWPVQSSSTTRLMRILFNSLTRENISVAESLRSAQLQIIRSAGSDPYHWAGFVLTGNASATVHHAPYY